MKKHVIIRFDMLRIVTKRRLKIKVFMQIVR